MGEELLTKKETHKHTNRRKQIQWSHLGDVQTKMTGDYGRWESQVHIIEYGNPIANAFTLPTALGLCTKNILNAYLGGK